MTEIIFPVKVSIITEVNAHVVFLCLRFTTNVVML